jgi:hypothetical protein
MLCTRVPLHNTIYTHSALATWKYNLILSISSGVHLTSMRWKSRPFFYNTFSAFPGALLPCGEQSMIGSHIRRNP